MSEERKLSAAGFARRIESELDAQGYPENHELRVAARYYMTTEAPAPTTALEAERDRLRVALEDIAQTKPHHAGQTPNEYHFQQIARAALAGGE